MRKGTKISLIVLGVFVALGGLVFVGADVVLSRLVKREIDKALQTQLPFGEASCGDVHVRLFSGTAEVNDLHFAYDSVMEVNVDEVQIGRVFYSALMTKKVLVADLWINHPTLRLTFDSKHPEDLFPKIEDTTHVDISRWIESMKLQRLHIHDACVNVYDIRTRQEIVLDSATVHLHDLAYNVLDTTYSYNDSIYRLDVHSFVVIVPEEPMRIEINNIRTRDAGALTVGPTHIKHEIAKKKLGERKKDFVTWIDLQINEVKTSPLNLFRKALAQDLTLDSLAVNVKKMEVYRDERFNPNKPFPMPQTVLTQMPVKFAIKHIDARMKQIDVEYTNTNVGCGEVHISNVRAAVEHLSNKAGNTIRVHGGCPIQEGKAKVEMTMAMNKSCDWSLSLQAENINTNYLNTFLRPLVGMTCDCNIDEINTSYQGNDVKATGTFLMRYHGLKIQVHKEDDIPYKIVTKNAGLISSVANSLIPKSNPTAVDIHPRTYSVEWKRDENKPFPLYMFGPCIDGVIETMLPGLFVHKQVKQAKK